MSTSATATATAAEVEMAWVGEQHAQAGLKGGADEVWCNPRCSRIFV
jgi:hypothetical protein